MFNMRLININDNIRIRTQSTFKVKSNIKLFNASEMRMAIYEVTLCSLISDKKYIVLYYEDGHAIDSFNYSKDIMSFERK